MNEDVVEKIFSNLSVKDLLRIEKVWVQFQYCVNQVLKHQKALGIGYMRERLAVD